MKNGVLTLAVIGLAAVPAVSRQDLSSVEISTTEVRTGISSLEGRARTLFAS